MTELDSGIDFEQIADDPLLHRLYNEYLERESSACSDSMRSESHNEALQAEINSTRSLRSPKFRTKRIRRNSSNKKDRSQLYIQMLEAKVTALKGEVEKLEAVNRANQDYLKKITVPEQIVCVFLMQINGFFVGRAQIMERISDLVKEQPTETNRKQLIKCISTLRVKNQEIQYRCGVNGKDRVRASNECFRELLELIVPESQKYLIYAASKELDIFDKTFIDKLGSGDLQPPPESQPWKRQIFMDMQLTADRVVAMTAFQDTIKKEKQIYDQLVMKFYNAKEQVCAHARHMEEYIDNFRGLLGPYQLGRILLDIERNRYRKEISIEIIEEFWNYQFSREEKKKVYERPEQPFSNQPTLWQQ